MAHEVDGYCNEERRRLYSRRGRETRSVDTVCIVSPSFYGSKSIARRSLEGIQERSQELQGKGRITRVLDKTRDSQRVANLVEDLRQAIVIYQVGTYKDPRERAELTLSDSYPNSGR